MKPIMVGIASVTLCGIAAAAAFRAHPPAENWNPNAAAAYLDYREGWWKNWPRASKDHGTFCVSCHTVLPYALSRPKLRAALRESDFSANERSLIESVRTRVRLWNEVYPYYGQMADQARGTEAVLNALILANYDAETGRLSPDTRSAFEHMWATQLREGTNKGRWLWIQFGNEPWEAPDSAYYGTVLAAAAVGIAPEDYRTSPEIQPSVRLMNDYLVRESAKQSLMNRVILLWASGKLPGILDAQQQKAIMDEAFAKENADGGWSTSSLIEGWKRGDGTRQPTESDGYATGQAVLALTQASLSPNDARLERARAWLIRNQSWWDGHWPAYSLNKRHYNPLEGGARFMDDAATAYAVLALTEPEKTSSNETAVASQ